MLTGFRGGVVSARRRSIKPVDPDEIIANAVTTANGLLGSPTTSSAVAINHAADQASHALQLKASRRIQTSADYMGEPIRASRRECGPGAPAVVTRRTSDRLAGATARCVFAVTPVAVIVEDDPAILQLIAITLEGRGYRTVPCPDGCAGLAAVRRERPDVVCLDIGLSDIDGLQVLGLIKEDPELRGIPVLMVTAWNEPQTIRLAMDRGARDYVSKPFDLNDLAARVDAACAASQPQAEALDDPVTALPTRPHMDIALQRQAIASRRTGKPFALVVADLDHFTALNDEHGRAAGDDVLRAAAERLRRRSGVSDVLVRWTGDRFAMLVPGADWAEAGSRAEALRVALADEPLDTPGRPIPVTASFGIAQFAPGEHADDTIARAEQAVREAKHDGRNRVRRAVLAPAPA